jgi:putative flippase GtrA
MVLANVEKGKARSGAWLALRPAIPLITYLLLGTCSFAVDFSVYFGLAIGEGLDPLIANLVSRPMGGMTCFLLNRRFTFRAIDASPLKVQMIRFWCVWGLSMALTEGLLALFVKGLHFSPGPGKALAEAIALLFNFLALKHWTFQRASRRSDPA